MERCENGAEVGKGEVDGVGVEKCKINGESEVKVKEVRHSGVSKIKTTKKPLSVGHDQPKTGKAVKGEGGHDGLAASVKKHKPELSHSHSFPSKGKMASGVKKSLTESKSVKADVEAHEIHESVVVEDSAKYSNQSFSPETHELLVVNSTPINGTSTDSSVETQQEKCDNLHTSDHLDYSKSDDDAHSTSSSTSPRATSAQRKSSGSGFASRLGERAEKRKEFLQKLEEKIQAKEAEKNNLQAKSKEDQEAAIKKLRKSLAFKATPMPSFYKEPGPPKVELKKIPPTRAVSPKLGRPKPSTNGEGKPSSKTTESKVETIKSHSDTANVTIDSLASKKTIKKTPVKSPPQKSTKIVAKSTVSKAKVSETDKRTSEAAAMQDHDPNPQCNVNIQHNAADKKLEDDGALFGLSNNIPNPEVAAGQVSVMG